jgi:hypothetical protein
LAEVLDQEISHDQVTRFLSEREYTSQDLWLKVKKSARKIESQDISIPVAFEWVKSNASLAKSPTRRVMTQNNHVFMSIYALFKLESLKIKHKANHFALRAKLFIKATQQALAQLKNLRAA